MLSSIVLSANFVTLVGIVATAATTIVVTTITSGRSARRDAKELQRLVVGGYLDTVSRVDSAHDEVKTNNGSTLGQYVVASAAALKEHTEQDAANFAELRRLIGQR